MHIEVDRKNKKSTIILSSSSRRAQGSTYTAGYQARQAGLFNFDVSFLCDT